jgi:hypothetical protein
MHSSEPEETAIEYSRERILMSRNSIPKSLESCDLLYLCALPGRMV